MNVTEALGWTLIHFLWQGTLIGVCAAALWMSLRRRSANARYLAACAALLLMAATPIATFAWLQMEPAAAVAAMPSATGREFPIEAFEQARMPIPPDAFPRLIAVWLAGVSLVSAWSVLGWLGVSRLKRRGVSAAPALWRRHLESLCLRMGIRRSVELLESTLVRVPSVVGLIRPVVLIPASALLNVPPRHLEALLAHELAHIVRHDYLVNLLQRVVEALLFYHPAVWWVSHRIRVEREHCCDDLAVAVCGDVLTYARALTGLEEALIAAGCALAANGASLVARVRRLTSRRENGAPGRGSWILAGIPLLLALTMWAGPGLVDRDARQAAAPEPPQRPAQPAAPAKPSAGARKPAAPAPAAAATAAVAPTTAAAAAPRAPGFLAALAAAGYGDLSVDEIIELKSQGVTEQFLLGMNGSGFGRLSPKQLIELRVHGVNPDYVRHMHESGIRDLTVRDIAELRMHGVNPEHLQEIHSLGFGPFTAREAIELRNNGVSPDLFRALKESGFTRIDAREAVEARMYGLRASDLQEARKYGSNLSLKQILRLKQAGVL